MNVEAYAELETATNAAWAAFVEGSIAAFERLAEADPELAQIATDLYGSSRIAAIVFAQPGASDRRSNYARLAAGEREKVRDDMVRAAHGMF
jgi:hypothetical protein